MTAARDARWERIVENAPSDLLIALAKKCPGHSLDKLYNDQETRVDEVFRVCDSNTIDTLYVEFPQPSNLVGWLYEAEGNVTKREINNALDRLVKRDLTDGVKPNIEKKPTIYKVERSESSVLFRWVAADRQQNLPVAFGESESIAVLSYYEAILHFSDVEALVFGPFSAHIAADVMSEMDLFLGTNGQWKLLKPTIGQSREFYSAIKKSLGALLIETKRHDLTGDYQTVALQARDKNPDLEQVPSFKKLYLEADSYYDVLEYKCKNAFGFSETVNVKFGRPFGRFTFAPNPSISAIRYFRSKVSELLRRA
jgi:hypothetical protein